MSRPTITSLEFHRPSPDAPATARLRGRNRSGLGRGGIFVFLRQEGNDWAHYQPVSEDRITDLGEDEFQFQIEIQPDSMPPDGAEGDLAIDVFHRVDSLHAPSTDFDRPGDCAIEVPFRTTVVDSQCISTTFPPRCPPPPPDLILIECDE